MNQDVSEFPVYCDCIWIALGRDLEGSQVCGRVSYDNCPWTTAGAKDLCRHYKKRLDPCHYKKYFRLIR